MLRTIGRIADGSATGRPSSVAAMKARSSSHPREPKAAMQMRGSSSRTEQPRNSFLKKLAIIAVQTRSMAQMRRQISSRGGFQCLLLMAAKTNNLRAESATLSFSLRRPRQAVSTSAGQQGRIRECRFVVRQMASQSKDGARLFVNCSLINTVPTQARSCFPIRLRGEEDHDAGRRTCLAEGLGSGRPFCKQHVMLLCV